MEDNKKLSKGQKALYTRNSHNGQKSIISSISNTAKVGSASISLNREGTGASQIWAKLWEVCVRLHQIVSSLTCPETTTPIGQPTKKAQTEIASPDYPRKQAHPHHSQHLPRATSLRVKQLVKKLKQRKLTVRAEGARVLGEIGENAPIEPLLQALQDEQRFVRAEAARALGKLGERVPTAPLVVALRDKDGSVRVAAAQALGMLGKLASLEDLLQALTDPWPPVREATVLALGKLEEQVPPETFLFVLQDEDKFVRAAALSALGTLGERAPIQQLVNALGDVQKMVREAAIQALVTQRERVPIDALADVLKNSKWAPMREAAAKVLSMSGERVPIELLESASTDEWPPVRAVAEPALLKRSPMAAVPTHKDEVVPKTVLPGSKHNPAKIETVAATDSHDKHLFKSMISRFVASQSVQPANLHMPDWVRQNTVVLVIVILGTVLLFSQKKRILSIFMDSTPRTL